MIRGASYRNGSYDPPRLGCQMLDTHITKPVFDRGHAEDIAAWPLAARVA